MSFLVLFFIVCHIKNPVSFYNLFYILQIFMLIIFVLYCVCETETCFYCNVVYYIRFFEKLNNKFGYNGVRKILSFVFID